MKKISSYIAVVLWMLLIFKLSAQTVQQSGNLSSGVSNINIKVIEKVKPNARFDIKEFHHKIRKNAHFFVYLFLGVFVINALRRSGTYGYRCVIFTLLTCIIYAISDEFHQSFVPGRSSEMMDVFIDSGGATVGILIYLGFSRIKKKINSSKNPSYIEK